jgi:hypothetical protein
MQRLAHGEAQADVARSFNVSQAFAIFFTGDLLREYAFSSRRSAFDQGRRLVRLARFLAIGHCCERHATAPRHPSKRADLVARLTSQTLRKLS